MATDLQYREGLTDTQKKQLVTRLDRINAGSAITDTDKANFNYGLGSSWQSYLSPSVNYNDLGKTPSPTVGTQTQPKTTADTVMAGLNAGQQAQLTAQQQQMQNDLQVYKDIQMLQGENKAETTYNQATQGLSDLRTKEQKKSQALAEAYKSGGVQEYQKKLDELKQQAAQLSGSYLQGLTNVEGKVMPMRFITGQQAQMQKQYAAQASAVALEQQAIQGNIENAKKIAQDMVDLEYGDIEAQIANQKELINLNYANLTREDKKRADEQKYLLDQRQARIDEEKQTKKDIQSLLVEAIGKKAPASVQSAIKNAKTVEEAAMAASGYLGDEQTDFGVIGQDDNGNNIYGFIDKVNKTVTGINGQPTTSPTENVFVTSASADELAEAIKQVESGGNYNAKGASGENGAYQFMPDTWTQWSSEYARNVLQQSNAKLPMTPENQDAVAKWKIQQWLNQGLTPQQVAAKWNSGSEFGWENKKGVNSKGVAYDVPAYVNKVNNALGGNKTELTGADKIAQDIFDGVSNLNVNTLSTKIKDKVQNRLSELKREALQRGDTEGILRASAGGKEVDSSMLTSFEKAINVIYQIGDLQETFKQDKGKVTNQDGVTTKFDLNPILGIVRSKNPYDTKAKQIQAQLQAIVPNLARGIYGEVGVLTDNDIKNYSQTLPNLTSTEDVRQAVLGITIRSIQRSIENKLKSQASGGRDVSGFVDQYNAIKILADELLGETTNVTQSSGNTWKSTSGKSYVLPY